MTSESRDILYSIAVEEKDLEMLIISSIQTLKRENKECGNEEVFNLVKDSVDGVIKKEVFNNLLDILVQKESIKKQTNKQTNKIGNRECLTHPKKALQVSDEFLISGKNMLTAVKQLYNPVGQSKIQDKQLLKYCAVKHSFNQILKVL